MLRLFSVMKMTKNGILDTCDPVLCNSLVRYDVYFTPGPDLCHRKRMGNSHFLGVVSLDKFVSFPQTLFPVRNRAHFCDNATNKNQEQSLSPHPSNFPLFGPLPWAFWFKAINSWLQVASSEKYLSWGHFRLDFSLKVFSLRNRGLGPKRPWNPGVSVSGVKRWCFWFQPGSEKEPVPFSGVC